MICNSRDPRSLRACAAFLAKVAAHGAEVLEPKWLGIHTPHRVMCSQGHISYPWPSSVLQGRGVCKTCAGQDSAVAWANFQARVEELGGEVLEPEWLGSCKPHRVRCALGHKCQPRPNDVQQGQGICDTCGRMNRVDPRIAAAEAKFWARVEALGAVVSPDSVYVNSITPVHIICANGHDCMPRPNDVCNKEQGICAICVGHDPAVAEAAFRASLAEMGATLLEPYYNAVTPHRVRCVRGHNWNPTPNSVQQGSGCGKCARMDRVDPRCAPAWANFKARVGAQGGEVLEKKWQGNGAKHRIRCGQGHIGWPTPNSVQAGNGICAKCSGKVWDVFYLVTSPLGLKFGISSGDPNGRLRLHHRDGYTERVRVFTGLPDGVAKALEDKLRYELRAAEYAAVSGREYFGSEALSFVLRIVDSALANYAECELIYQVASAHGAGGHRAVSMIMSTACPNDT